MTRLLLAHGARPTVADDSGDTPLHVAVRIGYVDLCVLLVQSGADLYGRDKDGATAIHLAARFGHTALVKTLVTVLEVFNQFICFGQIYIRLVFLPFCSIPMQNRAIAISHLPTATTVRQNYSRFH